jgi:putative GTP pyrophosphokinase
MGYTGGPIMAWATVRYLPGQIDAAGDILVVPSASDEAVESALEIINNWRSCHGFPLNTFQQTLRRKAVAVDPSATVAQRKEGSHLEKGSHFLLKLDAEA